MNKLILAAAFSAAFALPAAAANTALILWNQADPGGFETATGTGSASILGSDLDGITISVSNVNRETSPNGITESNINLDNTTNTVQVLHIIAGANGFAGPSNDFNLSATILTALGSSDLSGSFFADNSNTLNGTGFGITGVDIGDFDSGTLTGPQSFSFNGVGFDSVIGPYGLAEALTLTLQPGAMIGVQSISMDARAVPELSTWAMLLVGGGFMAWGAMARKKVRTFAV
jgi:hypothetical protein